MLISKSNLSLDSRHELQTSSLMQLRIESAPRAAASFGQMLERQLQSPPAQLLQIEAPAAADAAVAKKAAESPFQAIMELLFGLPHAPDDAAPRDGNASRQAFPGEVRAMRLVQTSETESCTFAASGNICLADGSERQFDIGYRMDRSEQTTEVSTAAFKDPLVVDFGVPANALGRHDVAFDLDSDGKAENMRLPTGDAALLFCDRNHNGKADDGSELFGPQTGNGFGELAKLDSDGNGWIDGGDTAYADLMLWQVTDDGASRSRSLAAAGIGALATASAATPFTLKENGAAIGQVQSSSVWLGEKSGAGIVRQIDVATTPQRAEDA